MRGGSGDLFILPITSCWLLIPSVYAIIPPYTAVLSARHFRDVGNSINFGTAQSFNYDAAIKLRRSHETHESRSAITYRYRHARDFSQTDHHGPEQHMVPVSSGSESLAPSSAKSEQVKGRILKEIISSISGSLIVPEDGARQPSGSSTRLARW